MALSIRAQEISDMLEKQHGIIAGVARIDLPTPIKVRPPTVLVEIRCDAYSFSIVFPQTLGSHTVKIRVDEEVEKEVAAAEAEEGVETPAVDQSKKQFVELSVQVVRR
jgi:hypothetical protein